MDPKEILRHLQYRINVTPDSDPEKENAIRLRDRLLAKYGMRLEDLIEQRKHRIFGPLVKSDAKLVFQYFRRRLDAVAQEPPYNIDCFLLNIKKTARHTIELDLTDTEYSFHYPIVSNLLEMYRKVQKDFEKKIKAENTRRRKALNYEFFEKADLLQPYDPTKPPRKRKWNLADAMAAARELEGLIFPEQQIQQDRLRIAGESK
jgi:hypothetical protein